ncbi:MAG: adenosylcobinamide-GDP ribazoletransferase [Dehalococcoidia bacterium]|jgi:adenosylcobinamide-GDP ribazoletransferase
MLFYIALKFLTILPAPSSKNEGPEQVGRSLGFFPVVGLVIGLLLAGLYCLMRGIFPVPLVNAILITALVLVTGAHHLDGLSDTFDALVAGRTTEQRLSIMTDTRVGVFGISAIVLTLLIKYASLTGIASVPTLIMVPVVSRWTMAGAILIFPAARKVGMGFAAKSGASWTGFVVASVVALLVMTLFGGWIAGPILMAVLFSLMCCFGLLFRRLFGGLTGDCYGALVELGEVMALILISILSFLRTSNPQLYLITAPLIGW